jgi:cytochrome c peroxidase
MTSFAPTKRPRRPAAIELALVLSLVCSCLVPAFASAPTPVAEIHLEDEPIRPLDSPSGLDPKRIALGKKLFNDPILSSNNEISCATCHDLQQGGTKHVALSLPGASGKSIPIRIPTVIGAGLNFSQFWDGRASTLEEQIDGPTLNSDEMGSTWPSVIQRLVQSKVYNQAFIDVYHSQPTTENVKNAIATFERAIVYTDSPFDLYLRGNNNAISAQAKEGYQLFKDLGCASCHQGQNVGGNMFQKFGIVEDYFAKRGHVIEQDYGRFDVTHDENDRYYFKVPSLRNVELVAPYFHDGSAQTLDDAVQTMATYQLGRTISEQERNRLVAFLKSLTGKPPSIVLQEGAPHD